ncbi:MAG: hypothetical protein AB7S50_10860 [Bacteroidales bacterium]
MRSKPQTKDLEKDKKHLVESLSSHLFWDVDIALLEQEKSKRLIIERVFALGNSREIMQVINYYGKPTILNVLENLNYIDSKTLNFISKLFNTPLNKFKCYIRKQSIPQHWDC